MSEYFQHYTITTWQSYQVPLREEGWTLLNTAVAADRSDFMHVLKSLRRVLVKATLAENILSTSIADVSMDTATDQLQVNAQFAKGIEVSWFFINK